MVKRYRKLGFDIYVESEAGLKAGFTDSDYEKQGAKVVSVEEAWS